MKDVFTIHPGDNVGITLKDLPREGQETVLRGHKIALKDIPAGQTVYKYGHPIGTATQNIRAGEHVHAHNLKTRLEGILDYAYKPDAGARKNGAAADCAFTFKGYARKDGRVGIRNELWVVPTVGCVNKTAENIVREFQERVPESKGSVLAITHPHGCSQLGDDLEQTQKILAGLANHPNAGAVLILGLGCESNQTSSFKQHLRPHDPERVAFLASQDAEDEVEEALGIMERLYEKMRGDARTEMPLSKLVFGLKCGGSDAFSGITANPLLGSFSDLLAQRGGSFMLTEVPEMFGAEEILMARCEDESRFRSTVNLINDFKRYFMAHGQPIYENPSPGNKQGGITTLEEKSLGCIQKGGHSAVRDVIGYGESVRKPGLTLLESPGNDVISSTALAAAGCHMVLFTTGRGTPYGTVVPTVKISTQTPLFEKKRRWIDFDAGKLLDGAAMKDVTEEFTKYICGVADGRPALNETNGQKEIAIFKKGITL